MVPVGGGKTLEYGGCSARSAAATARNDVRCCLPSVDYLVNIEGLFRHLAAFGHHAGGAHRGRRRHDGRGARCRWLCRRDKRRHLAQLLVHYGVGLGVCRKRARNLQGRHSLLGLAVLLLVQVVDHDPEAVELQCLPLELCVDQRRQHPGVGARLLRRGQQCLEVVDLDHRRGARVNLGHVERRRIAGRHLQQPGRLGQPMHV